MRIALIFVLAAAASAENWPQFRGENARGLGNGDPPIEWSVENGDNVAWKTPIPGLAHSSPIVWGKRVFLTTAVNAAGDPELGVGWMGGTGRRSSRSSSAVS